jgi:hypothetical protein
MFFSKDKRPGVVADNPGMPFGEVGKTIGEMWRELEDSDRAPYQAQADADKKRYEREQKAAKSAAPAEEEEEEEEDE